MQSLKTSDYRGYNSNGWTASHEDEEDSYPLYVPLRRYLALFSYVFLLQPVGDESSLTRWVSFERGEYARGRRVQELERGRSKNGRCGVESGQRIVNTLWRRRRRLQQQPQYHHRHHRHHHHRP